jgi:predicted  nucleic acid-binding Zn-ribbon protein
MLNILFGIQKLEAEERVIAAEKANCWEHNELRSIKTVFESKKAMLLELNKAILTKAETLARLDKENVTLHKKLEKEKAALYDGSVTNPKELQAREKQIEALKEQMTMLEENKAAEEKDLEKANTEANELQKDLTAAYEDFNEIKKVYKQLVDDWQKSLDNVLAKKTALWQEVDIFWQKWYKENSVKFAGNPVAQLVSGNVCSGCRTVVPPAIALRARYIENKTICENCGRLLFIEEK